MIQRPYAALFSYPDVEGSNGVELAERKPNLSKFRGKSARNISASINISKLSSKLVALL